jgi:hypothetical protein
MRLFEGLRVRAFWQRGAKIVKKKPRQVLHLPGFSFANSKTSRAGGKPGGDNKAVNNYLRTGHDRHLSGKDTAVSNTFQL